MPRKLDLSGKKFGYLKVIGESAERINHYKAWNCICDCGNILQVSSRDLFTKKELSCGCMQKQYPAKLGNIPENLTGKRFGRLSVLHRTDNRNGRVCWECLCDCGNTCSVTSMLLKSGKTRSCGCLRSEEGRRRAVDLSGQRFGSLTALCATDERDRKSSVMWHCRCECGNETDVSEDGLRFGRHISCGCKKKEMQSRIGETLTFVDGTCIEWLKNRKERCDNTSGFRGVSQRKNGRYKAEIGFKGKRFYLGLYDTYEEAVNVRLNAERFIHNEYIARYEQWKTAVEKTYAIKDGSWETVHPLLFEVSKPEPGVLQIETGEGNYYLYYCTESSVDSVFQPKSKVG